MIEFLSLPSVDGCLAIIVCFFVLLDIATGILKAIKNNEFTSSGLREGGAHKASYLLLVAAGYGLDWGQMHANLGVTVPAYGAICVFIIAIEIVSIVENILIINPDIDAAKLYEILNIKKEN